MSMRFGIFDHLEQRDVSLTQLYKERLDYLEFADAAGFWGYHKAEHHFVPLDAAPSGNVFLAAVSQRTRYIRFGPLVYLLPFYHPIRLIEEICQLDHLSEGRLEFGIGRGISPPEHEMWGIAPDEARARSEEVLEILIKGLTHETLTHHGQFYDFDAVPMLMQPVQQPHPPIWYPGNVEFAARHHLNAMGKGDATMVAESLQRFSEIAAEPRTDNRLNARTAPPTVGVTRHIYLADSDAEAQARARQAYVAMHLNLTTLFRQLKVTPPLDPTFGGDFDRASAAQAVLAGSPATVRAHAAEFEATSGCEYYVGAFAFGDLTHAEYMRSIELFADEVMPHFRDAAAA